MTDEKKWTPTQVRRLTELGIDPEQLDADFNTPAERNKIFQQLEKKQVQFQKKKLMELLTHTRKTAVQQMEENLSKALFDQGFTRVSTPTIITARALEKMSIDENHPLAQQVFWLNKKQCLRPMLAPNLYGLMQDFSRLNRGPTRFFEIGPCFRKESRGAHHANEFTMLNLVEMGLPREERNQRLTRLAEIIMAAAGVEIFQFEQEDSKVYGTTVDVVAGPEKIEVASGAMGPHPLDGAWGITDTWVGLGFGIERLTMISRNDTSLGKWSKSLSWLDGISLKV